MSKACLLHQSRKLQRNKLELLPIESAVKNVHKMMISCYWLSSSSCLIIFETQSSPGVVYADYSCQLTHFIRCNLLKTFISLVSKLERQGTSGLTSLFNFLLFSNWKRWKIWELDGGRVKRMAIFQAFSMNACKNAFKQWFATMY